MKKYWKYSYGSDVNKCLEIIKLPIFTSRGINYDHVLKPCTWITINYIKRIKVNRKLLIDWLLVVLMVPSVDGRLDYAAHLCGGKILSD